jgi:predicted nucleotidyltransferase
MIILSFSLSDYMVLTLKTELYKKSDHGIINELKYIISAQRVIVDYNVTHLLVWSVNLVLLQI